MVDADFHNADAEGRLRLNTIGTIRDPSRLNITLRDRLALTLHDEELKVDGEVRFSPGGRLWVAAIDWDAIHPRSRVGRVLGPDEPAGTGGDRP